MSTLMRDLHHALRGVRRAPGPALAIVLTIALGIGPMTAVFSALYGVLLRPLPYRDPGQLVRLRQPADDGGPPLAFNVPEMADYRERAGALSGVVEYHTLWFNLIEGDRPERVQTGVVSWNYFEVLGVPPLLGRTFTAADDVVGAPRVLVLSHEYWQRRFAGDRTVVGRRVEMNQQLHEIVGVLPPIPRYPSSDDDVYMPASACPFRTPGWLNNRLARALTVFGRVRPGVAVEQAERDLGAVSHALHQEYPESYPNGRRFRLTATPLLEELTGEARTTLLLLTGTAAFVLLIVCANVANLTLARTLSRERDLALMTALGASRGLLIRRMLTESTVLALLGGALGLALAVALEGPLASFVGRLSPRAGDVSVDGPVLAFALVASVGTGLLVGLVPAFGRRRDPAQALREAGSGRRGGGITARAVLVVGQVALSCILLIGAGLLLRSLARLQAVDAGFAPEQVLTMRIDLDFSRYTPVGRARAGVADSDSGPTPLAFWDRLLDELAGEPTVQAGALASTVPLQGGLPQLQFEVRGRTVNAPGGVRWNVVSDGYLRAAGIELLAGRDFAGTDRQASPPVALVSQQLARQFWGDDSPIGSYISTGGTQPNWFEVIGVAADVRQDGLDAAPVPQVYLTVRQVPSLGATLLIRTATDPLAAEPLVRGVVRRVDPLQPVAFVQTLDQVRRDTLAPSRLTTLLLGLFALLALLVSAVGIAGVMAYVVSQRTREIGIRLAVGARPAEVGIMVVRQALVLVVTGAALGLAAAVLLSRTLSGLLFEVSVLDPLTYAAVVLVLVTVGVLAVAAPARRSAAVDPLKALRVDA